MYGVLNRYPRKEQESGLSLKCGIACLRLVWRLRSKSDCSCTFKSREREKVQEKEYFGYLGPHPRSLGKATAPLRVTACSQGMAPLDQHHICIHAPLTRLQRTKYPDE